MIYLTWLIFFLLIGGCFGLLIKVIAAAGRGKTNSLSFHNQEQFVTSDSIVQVLPSRQIKNTHWFTHTFMRNRRKG